MVRNRDAEIHHHTARPRSRSIRDEYGRGRCASGKGEAGMTSGDAGVRGALLVIGVHVRCIGQQPYAQRKRQQPRIASPLPVRRLEDGGGLLHVNPMRPMLLRPREAANMPEVRALRQVTDGWRVELCARAGALRHTFRGTRGVW